MPVKLSSTGGGSVTLTTPSTASDFTATFPAATGNVVTDSATQTLTNKTISAPTISGATTFSGDATFSAALIPSSSFLRNRIINGDMRIDQRNAGASVTITTGGGYIYPVDRFGNFNNSGTNYTAEQVEDAPAGFYQSTKLTFGSAITLTTQNEATFFQIIEGHNVVDLGWGSASAQTITVSLWVKASFTGTFSIGFSNEGGTRTYATTYTISAANTWEYKTFTIPGDTSGTWLKTNGQGLYVRWNIIAGSNFQVSANNTWATRAGAYNAADGAYGTKAIGAASSISAGATWQITGVQLEVGTAATPFERRQFGQELALCQRYYEQFGSGYRVCVATTANTSSTQTVGPTRWRVQKRAVPTISVSGNWRTLGANQGTATTLSFMEIAVEGALAVGTVGSGYTQGQANMIQSNDDNNGLIQVASEL